MIRKWAIGIILILLLSGCTNKKYVPVNTPTPRLHSTITIITITPIPTPKKDPCLEPLKKAIVGYENGSVSSVELTEIANHCTDYNIYVRVSWAINTGETKVLSDILDY